MKTTLALLLPIILVAGCIGGGSNSATPDTGLFLGVFDNEPEAAAIPTLPIGLMLGDGETADTVALAVTIKNIEVSDSYTTDQGTITAGEGKTFVLADVTIVHKANGEIEAGRDKLFVADGGMVGSYPSSYSGNNGLVGSTLLSGGQTISGRAAFEVQKGLEGLRIVYHFGPHITVTNMVGWHVPG